MRSIAEGVLRRGYCGGSIAEEEYCGRGGSPLTRRLERERRGLEAQGAPRIGLIRRRNREGMAAKGGRRKREEGEKRRNVREEERTGGRRLTEGRQLREARGATRVDRDRDLVQGRDPVPQEPCRR